MSALGNDVTHTIFRHDKKILSCFIHGSNTGGFGFVRAKLVGFFNPLCRDFKQVTSLRSAETLSRYATEQCV